MKEKIKILILLCTISLLSSACEKKESVDYGEQTEEALATDSGQEGETGVVGLEEALGVTDYSWKEEIEAKNRTIQLYTSITIPPTDKLYTMKVREKYLTNEDKKKIMTYFVDEKDIKVNIDICETKESLESMISDIKEDMSVIDKDYMENYIEYLEKKLEAAPLRNEISEECGDYDQDFYIAKTGDDEIYFSFYSNKEYNRSAFCMRKHYDISKVSLGSKDNLSLLTDKEAGERAKKTCEDLGLTGMEISYIEETTYEDSIEGSTNEYGLEKWKDGYTVYLKRPIAQYTYTDNEFKVFVIDRYDDLTVPYSSEYVEVKVDDSGIRSITAQGLMEELETGGEVKLLELDKIKEIIKKTLEDMDGSEYLSTDSLRLTYERINTEDEDVYCYIPVWILGPDVQPNPYGTCYSWESYLVINAMDGAVIGVDDGLMRAIGWGMGEYE